VIESRAQIRKGEGGGLEVRSPCGHDRLLARIDLRGITLHCRGCRGAHLLPWKAVFAAVRAQWAEAREQGRAKPADRTLAV
jgi:hypothetical protein